MLLAIDIGNSNVVLGVFDGDRLRESWRIGTKASITADEYAHDHQGPVRIRRHPSSNRSTGDHLERGPAAPSDHERNVRKYFKLEPLVVTSDTRSGITLKYDSPREIGADRIVNAAAAYKLFGGPLIIVDFGTATTFCAVTKSGEYLGGAITPGLKISAEALYQRAAKLPRVELVRPRTIIGRDTISAMQAGILYGYAGLVDGIVERMKNELGATQRWSPPAGWPNWWLPKRRPSRR